MKLDKWQKEVLETEGNIVLRSGRQVGKSTIISIKAGEYAIKNSNKTILIIASVERQALLLFEKVLAYIFEKYRSQIKKGADKPTKHTLKLKNGSVIHCLPTGMSGYGIRGYTIDLLIADEAAFIPEEVWTAVTPMLAVTKGDIILLSTPFGKSGFFYKRFTDPAYKSFHVSSEDCKRISQEHLDQRKKEMSKMEYAQEYLGEFVSDLLQFFPDDLIKETCTLMRTGINPHKDYFMGVDIAGMGKDETTYEILDGTHKLSAYQKESIIKRGQRTNVTTDDIIMLNARWNFNKIGIDDGGMGVGVFDQLLVTDSTKRKVIALNNAKRFIEKNKKRSKKLLKEDMYNNLLGMMQRKEIKLLNDDNVIESLRSIQSEYTDDKQHKRILRLFGNYTHIAEGLIRAAWCIKTKRLNIWIR